MNSTVPIWIDDPTNAAILAVSEDRLQGFQVDPFGEIAARSGVDVATVLERVRAMLRAGTIRRVRQTLMATNLADGSLCAWQVPPERLSDAFDFLFREDPFSGHVVIRTTDAATPGSNYRLWTTLKVPQGFSIAKHAAFLAHTIGAEAHRLMPAKALFALGVGHVRRRGIEPGARADALADVKDTTIVALSPLEWRVLSAVKRELAESEIAREVWDARAREAGVPLDEFVRVARELNAKGVVGRFSTFLEHVKPNANAGGQSVTRYNALFHWKVPVGRELDAGREIGRHYIMTHAYWREGGPEFKGVNIMGVAHGTEKESVLAHKTAIDEHLREAGIDFGYTNVFWGGRSEIKPSEIAPAAYLEFCAKYDLDPETMR
ncbi:MAG: Lrp/AsnC family transcriptional regulator [Candidatus Eremiobacteraeota bacterium]|nr:Lrp/AsnC family transcriptional regulator [Candidatus Eremiobacteraeota bacterium]